MKEIVIKIQFNDEGGYKGHGDDVSELIVEGVRNFMKIDLESDSVIKSGWTVDLIKTVNIEPAALKFDCYEIWRPNIPAHGCTTQCKECADKQNNS